MKLLEITSDKLRDQSPRTAFVYQVFRNGELHGAALGRSFASVIRMAECEAHPDNTGSWGAVAMEDERGDEVISYPNAGEDGETVDLEFRDLAQVMSDDNAWVPCWVFKQDEIINEGHQTERP